MRLSDICILHNDDVAYERVLFPLGNGGGNPSKAKAFRF